MPFISSKLLILFIWACLSTLSSANQPWFWAHNCSSPFNPNHNPSPPPPTSPTSRTPPSQSLPPSPPRSRRPRTPPSQQMPSPPPPSPQLPPPPPPQSRRSRTPPSRQQSPPPTPPSRKIIVGGSEHWHLGFDYNDWALKNGPFHINDILVFKYDPPNSTTPAHSVYQLPNMRSFVNCDLGKAKMLANSTQGSTENGFEFQLKHQNPYYFACGEANGFHCQTGSMKFTLTPILQG
ncbi:hypothetical protein SDJN02_27761, partial [Cucurbita argyrosperma subsp. argyrosperma]